MAKVAALNKKQAADRRTALLGLAADRNAEQPGNCLTSRDMSELLEETCSAEQRQRFLLHLSSCDACYREWLELQQLLEVKAARTKPYLLRRKVLTVTGSLLAAAASVIFYLNLNQSGPYGPPVLPSPATDSVMEESSDRAKEPVRHKAVKKRALPAALEMEKSEAGNGRGQAESSVQVREKKAVTAKDDAVQSFSVTSSQTDGARLAAPVQQWLQRVAEKCSGLHSGQEWSMLAQQGRALPAADQFPQLPAIVDHVERLAGEGEYEIECAVIRRLLKENHDN